MDWSMYGSGSVCDSGGNLKKSWVHLASPLGPCTTGGSMYGSGSLYDRGEQFKKVVGSPGFALGSLHEVCVHVW